MSRLAGKTALITGASAGIGAETALLFAREGAQVVVAGSRRGGAAAVAERIVAAGGEAIGVDGDLAVEDDIRGIVDAAKSAFGRIDVLHSNAALTSAAAMARDLDIVTMSAEVWDQAYAINLRGPALLCKYVIPGMIEQGGGSIVMTGSGKGVQGDLMNSAYGATKAGLINLCRNVAAQYGKQGIRANILVVGLVLTEALAAGLPAEAQAAFAAHHLTPGLGLPIDVANAALFLASDEAAFVTGHELYVDGGFASHTPVYAELRRMMAAGAAPAA